MQSINCFIPGGSVGYSQLTALIKKLSFLVNSHTVASFLDTASQTLFMVNHI